MSAAYACLGLLCVLSPLCALVCWACCAVNKGESYE